MSSSDLAENQYLGYPTYVIHSYQFQIAFDINGFFDSLLIS